MESFRFLRGKTTSHFVVAVFFVVRRNLRELLSILNSPLESCRSLDSKYALKAHSSDVNFVVCLLEGLTRHVPLFTSPLPPRRREVDRGVGFCVFPQKNYIFYFSEKYTTT